MASAGRRQVVGALRWASGQRIPAPGASRKLARSLSHRQRRSPLIVPGARTRAARETSLSSWSWHNLCASMRTSARVSRRVGRAALPRLLAACAGQNWMGSSLEFNPLGAARKPWTSRSGAPTRRLTVRGFFYAVARRRTATRTGHERQRDPPRPPRRRLETPSPRHKYKKVGITLIFPQRITRRRARPRPGAPCPRAALTMRRRPSRCATFLRPTRPSRPPPRYPPLQ